MAKWKKIRRKKKRRQKRNLPATIPSKKPQKQKTKYDFAWKGVTQPKWKWSHDGTNLLIWRVDPVYGQPHHIEVTGPNFFRLAQGRVYVDKDGYTEIMVWADRGTTEHQEIAVDDVAQWLLDHTGRGHDVVTYEHEGFNWMSLGEGQMPTDDQIREHYYYLPPNQSPGSPEEFVYEPGSLQEDSLFGDYDDYKPYMFGDEGYGDDPNMAPGTPEEDWERKIERYWELVEKPVHSLTNAEWLELEALVDGNWDNVQEIWESRNWDADSLEELMK